MDDALYNQVKNIYRKDGSKSMTDFMEKAVRFYIGYLETNDGIKKIAPELVATYKEANMEALNRLSALMFKNAVETAVLTQLVAATNDVDPIKLKELKRECENEVRTTRGRFSLEDAYEWQKGGVYH